MNCHRLDQGSPTPISVKRNDKNVRENQRKLVAFHKKYQGKSEKFSSGNPDLEPGRFEDLMLFSSTYVENGIRLTLLQEHNNYNNDNNDRYIYIGLINISIRTFSVPIRTVINEGPV